MPAHDVTGSLCAVAESVLGISPMISIVNTFVEGASLKPSAREARTLANEKFVGSRKESDVDFPSVDSEQIRLGSEQVGQTRSWLRV